MQIEVLTCAAADAKAPNSKSVHPLVVVAAKAVGLHDAIMQLPKKYKTLLQEPGHNLGYHELNNAEMHLLGLARKNFEVRAKHSALRHTDTLWNKFSGKKPAGAVPDFDLLHAQWETRLSSARDRLRQRSLTQPKVMLQHARLVTVAMRNYKSIFIYRKFTQSIWCCRISHS